MTFCGTCTCRVEISADARRGWDHACRHGDKGHDHRVTAVVNERQREWLRPTGQEAATA